MRLVGAELLLERGPGEDATREKLRIRGEIFLEIRIARHEAAHVAGAGEVAHVAGHAVVALEELRAGIGRVDHARDVVAAFVIVLDDGDVLDAVGRLPADGAAERLDILLAEVAVVEQVLLIGAAMGIGAGKTNAERFADRKRDRAFQIRRLMIAVAALDIAVELLGGLGGLVEDRAAGRVAAEQRTLRALQDLDVLEIVERACTIFRDRNVVGVDNDGWRRVGIGVDALAADRIAELVRAAARPDDQARYRRLQVGVVEDGALLERRAADRRDRDRHLLDIFRHAAGGHDDFFHPVACRAFVGGLRGGLRPERGGHHHRKSREKDAARNGLHIMPLS